jgi:hypothetical protein
VIIINAVGYTQLHDMSQPIATANVVQFMAIRANHVLLYSTRLASGRFFDGTFSFTGPELAPGQENSMFPYYKAILRKDYASIRLEYETMM